MRNFSFCGRHEHEPTTFFVFLNFDTVLNSTPEQIPNIWRIEQHGINVIKFEAARRQFSSDLFVTVAVDQGHPTGTFE